MIRFADFQFRSRRRFGALAALCLTLSACGGGGSGMLDFDDNLPKPTDYPIHGIDVSKYQGEIDWNAVASSGVKFAWIKATEGGDHLDDRFQANWQGAKQAGVPHGAYLFAYWCRAPIDEAMWFEQNVPVEDDALPPVLDVEPTPDSRTCRRRLERDSTVAAMKVMLEEMERHFGKRPIIYTSIDFYRAILADGAFADYPIWVRSTKHNPAVPYGDRAWNFWQYQADGTVPGIDGNVDRNAFSGDQTQWRAFVDGQTAVAAAARQGATGGAQAYAQPTQAQAALTQPAQTQAALAPPLSLAPMNGSGSN
ncbi:MAG: glycosyl hydrolase family 25 [Bradyrhizobium sp.]|nr:MAG: glycosyl hydrolase family 25 [Bradyrhizobium sp.]